MNYEIISWTPAGRKSYIEILDKYLILNKNIIKRHIWYINTKDEKNIEFIKELCNKEPDFYSYLKAPKVAGCRSICHMFKNTVNENAIYIRLDDDIVFLKEDAIENLVKFRLENPQYFLVSANVINNGITSHIYNRNDLIGESGFYGYDCIDRLGWDSLNGWKEIHEKFFEKYKENKIKDFNCFERWSFHKHERFSINLICYFGKDMASINGKIDADEEQHLTMRLPKQLKKINTICGNSIAVHFAFGPQRKKIENDEFINFYKEISLK